MLIFVGCYQCSLGKFKPVAGEWVAKKLANKKTREILRRGDMNVNKGFY